MERGKDALLNELTRRVVRARINAIAQGVERIGASDPEKRIEASIMKGLHEVEAKTLDEVIALVHAHIA